MLCHEIRDAAERDQTVIRPASLCSERASLGLICEVEPRAVCRGSLVSCDHCILRSDWDRSLTLYLSVETRMHARQKKHETEDFFL